MNAYKIELLPLHMYCKTLQYQDGIGNFSLTVEDTPTGSLIIWELDIEADELRRKTVIENTKQFLLGKSRALEVCWGHKR
jgi:hypothetical protein